MKSYDYILKNDERLKALLNSITVEVELYNTGLENCAKNAKKIPYIEEVTLSLEEPKKLILEIIELKKENEFLIKQWQIKQRKSIK